MRSSEFDRYAIFFFLNILEIHLPIMDSRSEDEIKSTRSLIIRIELTNSWLSGRRRYHCIKSYFSTSVWFSWSQRRITRSSAGLPSEGENDGWRLERSEGSIWWEGVGGVQTYYGCHRPFPVYVYYSSHSTKGWINKRKKRTGKNKKSPIYAYTYELIEIIWYLFISSKILGIQEKFTTKRLPSTPIKTDAIQTWDDQYLLDFCIYDVCIRWGKRWKRKETILGNMIQAETPMEGKCLSSSSTPSHHVQEDLNSLDLSVSFSPPIRWGSIACARWLRYQL